MRKRNLTVPGALKYLSLIAAVFVVVVPILVVFFASFKSSEEYGGTSSLTPPSSWLYLDNYKRAIIEGNMLTGFMNTAIILVVSVTGAVIIGSMVSYVLSRFDFAGKKAILFAFLVATLIPGVTTQVATFKIVNTLGLFNTRLAAIVLYLGTDILSIYIFIQFMSNISVSLDESAMLDGASYFSIYARIILPLLKPAIATVFIIKGIGIYNDFYTPFLYMPAKELRTISTALYNFRGPYGSHQELICAVTVVAIVPTMIAFLSLQKYIYSGFTRGAVKM